MRRAKLTKEEVLSIPRMRGEGKTNAEIAEALGAKERTISYWVRRFKKLGQEMPRLRRTGPKGIILTPEDISTALRAARSPEPRP